MAVVEGMRPLVCTVPLLFFERAAFWVAIPYNPGGAPEESTCAEAAAPAAHDRGPG